MNKISDYLNTVWGHQGFQKYFKNTSWMFIANIVNFISSFLIFAVVARYLGPENLGKLNYAQSFVAIFAIFASLGMDQIIKRDLVKNPEKENVLLGTAIITKLLFGLATFIVLLSVAFSVNEEPLLNILIAILGLTFILNPINTLGILFDSKVNSKFNSIIKIFVAIFIPLLKILIIYADKGIIFLAGTLIIEALISIFISVHIYIKVYKKSLKKWTFDKQIFKKLISDSWPLLLAGVSVGIYSRIDQVMIQHMIDSSAVGIYSGGVKVTQIVQVIPGLILASLFPAIINAKEMDSRKYLNRIKKLAFFVTSLTILIIIPIFLFAPLVVKIILGGDFLDSISVLRIHLWSAVGIILLSIMNDYLVAENLGKIYFAITIIGAIINIIANFFLIHLIGVDGAALATLLSYLIMTASIVVFKKPKRDIRLAFKN